MPVPTIRNTTNPKQWGFHARLGDTLLRLSSSLEEPYRIMRGPAQTDTVNVQTNPEDFTDDYGRIYSQVEFTGGEGRRYAQRKSNEDQDQTKFWRSYGLRLDNEGNLSVVNTVEQIIAASAMTDCRSAYDGTDLWVTNGTTSLTRVQNLSAATPTTSSVATGLTNPVDDVAVLGGVVYACDGLSVVSNSGGTTTFAQVSPDNIVRLWRAKGRMMGSTGNVLIDDVGGTNTTLITLPVGQEWLDVVDGGRYVWAVASDGVLYAFTFDGTALSLAGETQFHQENPQAIAALYGTIFLITTQLEAGGTYTVRFWEGIEGDNGTVENLSVVREWESIVDFPHTLDETGRDFIYLDIVDPDTGDQTLYRYNLEFGGLFSDLRIDSSTTHATGFLMLEGKIWTTNHDGSVMRETSTRRTDALFVGPAVDFYNAKEKAWDSLVVQGDYGTNGTLTVSVSADPENMETALIDTGWTPVKAFTSSATSEVPLTVDPSRYQIVRIKVGGDAVLESYSLRAFPPLSDEQILLNVNVSDLITRPGKRPTVAKGYGDEIWKQVRGLHGEAVTLELYDLGVEWQGSISEVETPVTRVGPRGGVTTIMKVLYRGQPIQNTVIADEVWGGAQWGAALWGGTKTEDIA